jgi:hypothetical protein
MLRVVRISKQDLALKRASLLAMCPLKNFTIISFPQTCAHLLLQTFAPLMNQLPANSALHTAARNEQPIHITLKMATALFPKTLYNSQHLTRLIPES